MGCKEVANNFGLKLSVEKTKGMVVQEINECDVAPVQLEGGNLEVVNHFPYLGQSSLEMGKLQQR